MGCWKIKNSFIVCILQHYFDLFLTISLYSCSNFIMEKYTYVLKEWEKEWYRKIAVLFPNHHMNISLEYLEKNWVLANNHHSLMQNQVCLTDLILTNRVKSIVNWGRNNGYNLFWLWITLVLIAKCISHLPGKILTRELVVKNVSHKLVTIKSVLVLR